jgi:hypothetical protein
MAEDSRREVSLRPVGRPSPDVDGLSPAQSARERLGPRLQWVRLDGAGGRAYAFGLALAAAAILITAARLTPDVHGMGTHRQLGLPPCGFVEVTGLPCPSCGMTTAFASTVHGHVLQALRAQVAGLAMAVGTILVGVFGLAGAITGWRPAVNWYRVDPMRCVWWGTAALVAAWGLKIVLGLLDGTLPAR